MLFMILIMWLTLNAETGYLTFDIYGGKLSVRGWDVNPLNSITFANDVSVSKDTINADIGLSW